MAEKIKLWVYSEVDEDAGTADLIVHRDGEDREVGDWEKPVELPAKWVVCSRCEGKGTHTNPSVDGNGITPEEFAEDPNFMEDYINGVYDVQCSECRGRTTVLEIDESRLTVEQLALCHELYKQEDERARERHYDHITRLRESGYYGSY